MADSTVPISASAAANGSVPYGGELAQIASNLVPENWLFGAKLQNLMDAGIRKYMLSTFTYPREHEMSSTLREITKIRLSDTRAGAMVPPDEAQFLRLLVKITGAKRAMEIGVFTGYSLLNIALALPQDGTVLACDVYDKEFELGRPCLEKAGVAHKVDFRKCLAMDLLDSLIEQGEKDCFDFAFVDADKGNYVNYHERLMKLVRVRGVIVYDNTLLYGLVSGKDPFNLLEDATWKKSFEGIKALNALVSQDKRVEVAILALGDGVTVCSRVA